MIIDPSSLMVMAGVVGIGGVIGFWNNIKTYLRKITGLMVIRLSTNHNSGKNALCFLLREKFIKVGQPIDWNYTLFWSYIRPLAKTQWVPFLKIPILCLFDSSNLNFSI
mgnify:CR=1 FL=1